MADPFEGIDVRGAREHNLKNIDIRIPRNQVTVITGLSGSGKSSLAFDTIYAEGQRRYVDSLSTYARQFLDKLKKPDVDSISGLSPAVAIDQRTVGLSPRSTVGTVTELYDFLRLLYAKAGTAYCPDHNVPVAGRLPSQIVDDVMKMPPGTKFYVLAPVVQTKKGEFGAEFKKWLKNGFVQAKVDGLFIELEDATKLAKTKTHDIDLVVDRLVLKTDIARRLSEAIHRAVTLADGHVCIETASGERTTFSIHSACPVCGLSFPELEPRFFSFNNPKGACKTCHGLGTVDIEEIETQDYSHSENVKKIKVHYRVAERATVKSDDADSENSVDEFALRPCPDCKGSRLDVLPRQVRVGEKNISELSAMAATDLIKFLAKPLFGGQRQALAEKILEQLRSRLSFLDRVGAGYLSLDRPTRTLSGGESQRIRLASQIGSALVGVLYVLDEPSIGLHPRDHHRLLKLIHELKDLGNTILMVEHDEETILGADHLIDLGPRAGRLGGALIAQGTPAAVSKNLDSPTGAYLSGRKKISVPLTRRKGNGHFLDVFGATGNNLQNVNLKIPLGCFVSVTGVSGSGKSTLILDTLYRAAANSLYRSNWIVSPHKEIRGLEHIDKVIEISQSPIGRTPRSTPSTYVGLFPMIRDLYAQLPESKMRGYGPGRFSFNVKGGRCETCAGGGQVKVEMHFMSDVYVPCDTCGGKRYNAETLQVRFKDKNIADVLEMSVEQAFDFFQNQPNLKRKLETLMQVGLDYMTLGQSSTTLSGGEAQRVKLSRELSKRGTGKTLYILDEPTTGLHFADIEKLIELLQSLAAQGNTVVVIEHNLDVVKCSDYVIDLGPEGGSGGGQIVGQGTPESIAKLNTPTGTYLKPLLA